MNKEIKFIIKKMASDIRAPVTKEGKVREKIALKPGFHLADWVRLSRSMTAPTTQRKITRKELAEHNTQYDSWTLYKGKVYNISNYFPYHPGGDEILRQAAGTDCTELFDQHHKWVNMGSIMGKCLIGTIVEDDEDRNGGHSKDDSSNEIEESSP
jgi:cytochrome-b5 reductase